MASITGLGGAFLRADDPETLYAWYERHLGLVRSGGYFAFPASAQRGEIVLAFVGHEARPVALNLQVDDLDGLLDQLADEGVAVDHERERYDFGGFGWFTDPEGNRVELWEPAADA